MLVNVFQKRNQESKEQRATRTMEDIRNKMKSERQLSRRFIRRPK